MKKHILFCCLASIWLPGGVARGQQWTFGPKVRLPTSQNVDPVSVTTGPLRLDLGGRGGSTPGQWAAFARYDRSRFFAQGEGFTSALYMPNVVNDARGSSGASFRSRIVGTSLVAGVKPLPWLRLYFGAGYQFHNWQNRKYQNMDFGGIADQIEQRLREGLPDFLIESTEGDLRRYRLLEATNKAYREHVLTGQAGLGVDIGGLTVDLGYNRSLTPLLSDIPTASGTVKARQGYSGYMLSFGYRLLPIKTFLAAPRKRNPAYQRLKRDIPFYRNEFHVAGGLIGEDIGSAFTYENRYTRYLTRRFGVMGGLNVTRVFNTFDQGPGYGLPKHYDAFQLVTGLRVLPVYSRRHIIGITAGPTLTRETGVSAYSGGGNPKPGGGYYNYVNWRADSRLERVAVNWMSMIDYQFAATDRTVVGLWLRLNGIDYATLGIQAGYRF